MPLFFSNVSMAIGFSFLYRPGDALLDWPLLCQPPTLSICDVIKMLLAFAAVRIGDISVATPVLGIKIVTVSVLMLAIASEPVGSMLWIASNAAAIGVALIQRTGWGR